ncbi:MAG: DUF11 domain-containing protein, partial [Chloroflexi bacterium]|nr:DUF11 domain-containing protein [Chloroflexota bacterium]
DGGTVTDTTAITVLNVAPTITDVSNDGPVDEGSPVTIAITATDPSSDTLSYAYDWNDDGDFVDPGETLNYYTWFDDSTHTITVQVSDGDGGIVTDTTAITVLNVAPNVDAGSDQIVDEAQTVSFDGTFDDPGADTHDILWTFGDRVSVVGELAPTHTYTEPANFVATLTITDDDGGVGVGTITVTVKNLRPNADIGGPYNGTAGVSVALNASASSDPGGGDLTYAWDLDDNGEYNDTTGPIVDHTWTVSDVHTIAVQVTDAQGLTETATTTVTIIPASLHHIVLSPQTSTIFAWEIQTYMVEAFDVYDNSRGDVTDLTTFNIVGGGDGGSWENNIYTPGNHGDWTVRAVYSGTEDTADLTVLSPVLHIVKTAAPDPVEAGDNLTYTIAYSNTGNYTATAVIVTDELDPNVSYTDTPFWFVSDLAPGERRQITFTVSVARPLVNNTTLTNVAWINADHVVPIPVTQTTTVHSQPILTIAKLDDPDPVDAGQSLRYTIIITNSGNENATSVVVTEHYDPNVSFRPGWGAPPPDPGSENRIWTFPVLAVDTSQIINLFVKVTDPLPVGTVLTNVTTVESDQTMPITTTETTSVTSASDLTISKFGESPWGEAGENFKYFIEYDNSGTAPAENVVITETYDSRVSFISASMTPRTGTNNVWDIGDLNVDDDGFIIVTMQIDTPLTKDTILTNIITIDSIHTSPLSETETTTVSSTPDITLNIAESSNPVQAGDSLTYTLQYRNDGNADATQVVVTATLDTNVSFDRAWPTPTVGADNVWYWEVGEIAGEGGEGEIVVRTTVTTPLPNGKQLNLAAQLEYAEREPPVEPIQDTVQTTVASAPILPIRKSANAPIVDAGGFLTYTIVYSNTGNEIAHNVVITDVLDPNTIYDSASPSPTVRISDTLVYWNIGNLTTTVSGQITLRVRVNSPLPNNSILANTTWIDSDQTNPSSTVENTTIRSEPILHITKSGTPNPVNAGDILTYTFVYSNTGNEIAHTVVITDILDANVSYHSAFPTPSGGTVQNAPYWNVGDVPLSTPGQITLRVLVDSPLPNNTILTNTVFIGSDQTVPQSAQASTLVKSAPILHLEKFGSPDPVPAGDTLIYTLIYSNVGNEIAHGVVLTDILDDYTIYDSASLTPTSGTVQNTPYWVIGNVRPNDPRQIDLYVTVTLPLTNGTIITNTAFLDSDQTTPISTTKTTIITSNPILSLTKDDSVSVVGAGDTLTYTITYTNTGNENEYGIVITDTLPDHIEYVSCDPVANCQFVQSNEQVIFNIPTLVAQTYEQTRIIVRVDDPLPARTVIITNHVTMTAPSLSVPIHIEDVNSISTRPDLTVNVENTPNIFSPGELMSYNVIYGNIGHMDAENVVITTTLPTNTIYISSPGWSSSDGRTYVYTINGQLSANDTDNTTSFRVQYMTTEPQEVSPKEFHTIFTISEADNIGEDANLENNTDDADIGVPDLIVADFSSTPYPLKPNVPITFTIVLKNQGTGIAWNPSGQTGFYVDVFIASVNSYPWDRYSEIDVYDISASIAPHTMHTITLTHLGFSKEELANIPGFYAKVDNHEDHLYGLVPESNEMNNVGILPKQPYSISLPVVLR